jgi:hypothetical protein
MVFIGIAQQARLFDAAKQHLGPGGESIVRDAARQILDLPLDQVTYPQLSKLLKVLEREAPARLGREPATALAAALLQMRSEAEVSLGPRLLAAVTKRMGPAAEPFLENVCSRHGLLMATLNKPDLLTIAQVIKQDAAVLLGDEAAQGLALAVLESANARPAEFSPKILALASEHLGPEGEAIVRSLCRARLEVEVEDLDADGLSLLARVIEEDAPARIGATRATAFVAAARKSITSPAEELRKKVLELTVRWVGPVGSDFVEDVCDQNGLPFRAVDYEHLMWLAEALRGEAVPLVGKQGADELARGVRALLTGGR